MRKKSSSTACPDYFLLKKTIPTDIKKVIPLVDLVARKILGLTKSKDEAFIVKLTLEEALTNAIRHGNLLDPAKKVYLSIKASNTMITMDIRDQGKGFDYRHLPDPTLAANVDRPCGRGVFLMRRMMDSVVFYQKGSGVIMKRRFLKAA